MEHNSDYFSRIDISVKQKAPTSTVLVGLLCLISIFLSSFLFRNEKLALSSRASFQGENSKQDDSDRFNMRESSHSTQRPRFTRNET